MTETQIQIQIQVTPPENIEYLTKLHLIQRKIRFAIFAAASRFRSRKLQSRALK